MVQLPNLSQLIRISECDDSCLRASSSDDDAYSEQSINSAIRGVRASLGPTVGAKGGGMRKNDQFIVAMLVDRPVYRFYEEYRTTATAGADRIDVDVIREAETYVHAEQVPLFYDRDGKRERAVLPKKEVTRRRLIWWDLVQKFADVRIRAVMAFVWRHLKNLKGVLRYHWHVGTDTPQSKSRWMWSGSSGDAPDGDEEKRARANVTFLIHLAKRRWQRIHGSSSSQLDIFAQDDLNSSEPIRCAVALNALRDEFVDVTWLHQLPLSRDRVEQSVFIDWRVSDPSGWIRRPAEYVRPGVGGGEIVDNKAVAALHQLHELQVWITTLGETNTVVDTATSKGGGANDDAVVVTTDTSRETTSTSCLGLCGVGGPVVDLSTRGDGVPVCCLVKRNGFGGN